MRGGRRVRGVAAHPRDIVRSIGTPSCSEVDRIIGNPLRLLRGGSILLGRLLAVGGAIGVGRAAAAWSVVAAGLVSLLTAEPEAVGAVGGAAVVAAAPSVWADGAAAPSAGGAAAASVEALAPADPPSVLAGAVTAPAAPAGGSVGAPPATAAGASPPGAAGFGAVAGLGAAAAAGGGAPSPCCAAILAWAAATAGVSGNPGVESMPFMRESLRSRCRLFWNHTCTCRADTFSFFDSSRRVSRPARGPNQWSVREGRGRGGGCGGHRGRRDALQCSGASERALPRAAARPRPTHSPPFPATLPHSRARTQQPTQPRACRVNEWRGRAPRGSGGAVMAGAAMAQRMRAWEWIHRINLLQHAEGSLADLPARNLVLVVFISFCLRLERVAEGRLWRPALRCCFVHDHVGGRRGRRRWRRRARHRRRRRLRLGRRDHVHRLRRRRKRGGLLSLHSHSANKKPAEGDRECERTGEVVVTFGREKKGILVWTFIIPPSRMPSALFLRPADPPDSAISGPEANQTGRAGSTTHTLSYNSQLLFAKNRFRSLSLFRSFALAFSLPVCVLCVCYSSRRRAVTCVL